MSRLRQRVEKLEAKTGTAGTLADWTRFFQAATDDELREIESGDDAERRRQLLAEIGRRGGMQWPNLPSGLTG